MSNLIFIDQPTPFKRRKTNTALVGVPWDWESAIQGPRYFPSSFRQAGITLGKSFFHDRKINVYDTGDVYLDHRDRINWSKHMKEAASYLFSKNRHVVFLGGDHSITIPITNALRSNTTIIVFDAHADAISNLNYPLNTQVLSNLSNNKNIKTVVVIGCRSGYSDFKIKKVFYEDLKTSYRGMLSKGLSKIIDNSSSIYISFDFDVIDPVFISEVSYPQPLGIEPKIAIELLSKIIDYRTIGMDFVEFAPNLNTKISGSLYNAIEIILDAISRLR